MGDFNGHINGLGYQKQDRNGDMILEWINNNNMVLLNLDDKCEGNITWQRNEQKSVIDYIIVKGNIYKNIIKMEIDETKEKFDLSDHNLIDVCMNFQGSGINIIKSVTHQYYSTKKEDIRRYIERMEDLNDEKTEDAKVDISEFMKLMEKQQIQYYKKQLQEE